MESRGAKDKSNVKMEMSSVAKSGASFAYEFEGSVASEGKAKIYRQFS